MLNRKEKQQKWKEIDAEIKNIENKLRDLYKDYRREIEKYTESVAEQWEYLQERNLNTMELEELGRKGWELIAITSFEITEGGGLFGSSGPVNVVNLMYTFKRKIPDLPPEIQNKLAKYNVIIKLKERIEELKVEKQLLD